MRRIGGATVSQMERVRNEGGRVVAREVEFYNLDAIVAAWVNRLVSTSSTLSTPPTPKSH